MTVVSPYCYSWALGNNQYKITSFMDCKNKLNASSVTYAFILCDSTNNLSRDVYAAMNDLKAFQQGGCQVILSCGGADGPFLQDILNQDQIVSQLSDVLTTSGCRSLDFDIEGLAATLSSAAHYDKLNKAIAQLQSKFKNLEISYTLAVDFKGLSPDGVALLKNALDQKVDFQVINCMTMDYYTPLPTGKTWGAIACMIGDVVVEQMKVLFPSKTSPQRYSMLGLTPMIGLNDDKTLFSVDDAKTVAAYASKNSIGRISFWAIQRDQVGKGSLNLYSGVNNVDFEFFKAFSMGMPPPPTPPIKYVPTPMVPASVLDLKNWYVTLPTGAPKNPITVQQPTLNTFKDKDAFYVNDDSVVFKAPCGGVTTQNSLYPRSELREMNGNVHAAWSCISGTHSMTFTGRVQHLPSKKPEVVIGQIHNTSDDVIEILCSGSTISAMHNGTNYGVLEKSYTLGTEYTITITAAAGLITVDYNKNHKAAQLPCTSKLADNYFKVGCYTQSNPQKGDLASAYGEVWVSHIVVKHTP